MLTKARVKIEKMLLFVLKSVIIRGSMPRKRTGRKWYKHRVIILNRGSLFAFQWREFSTTVELHPETPPIDKRVIGNAAIPGERRIHTTPSPPPQLGLLANDPAVSSDVTLWRCTLRSGRIIASLSSRSLARHAPSI